MLRKLRLRLRAFLSPDDLRDELEFHIEQLTDQYVSEGMEPREAALAARRRFGNRGRIKEESHDVFALRLLEDFLTDLRYGLRSLGRNPSVALSAILSIGLAIGVNTLVFSLVRELFFSAPTTRAPQELVSLQLGENSHASLANLRDVDLSASLEKVAGYDVESSVNWRAGDLVGQTPVMMVSESYFEVMETQPVLGRVFLGQEAKAERNPHIVLISYRLWTRQFSQHPGITGRELFLNGRPYTVIGVLPANFRPPTFLNAVPDLFVPASAELNQALPLRRSNTLMLFARRKSDQTIEEARAAFQLAAGRLERDFPMDNKGFGRSSRMLPISGYGLLMDPEMMPLAAFAGILSAAVFTVLWIACLNVAGVLIARANARRKEIATRLAVGASRARLVRQLLTEALVLSGLGAIAGLGLHLYLTHIVRELSLPLPVPIVFQLTPDWSLMIYSIALTAIAAVLAGFAPSWQATSPALVSSLKIEESRFGHRRFTLRNGLIVGQIAITVVLLSTALLFTRSLLLVNALNPGFDLQHTAWVKLFLLRDRYTEPLAMQFASRALNAAEEIPGVASAALATTVPFNSSSRQGSTLHTRQLTEKMLFFETSVSGRYFETMGIPLLAGRPFTPSDRKSTAEVVIINHALAKRLFGDSLGVGERIWFGDTKQGLGAEVAGVVGDSKHMTMGEDQALAMYYPLAQKSLAGTEINVLVRANDDAASVTPALRKTLAALDETAAVDAGPLRTKLAFAYLPSQIGAIFIGGLGAIGLILALIGIFGTMAFEVSRRTAEIGIRLALGGSRWQVLSSVLGGVLITVCVGLALGIGVAFAVAQPLSFLLAQGIKPLDPLNFGSVAAICLLAAIVAAIIPAKRLLAVDPMNSLRAD